MCTTAQMVRRAVSAESAAGRLLRTSLPATQACVCPSQPLPCCTLQWFWDLRLQDPFRVAHCKFWSEFQGQRGYADVQALFFDAVRNELPGLGRYLQG